MPSITYLLQEYFLYSISFNGYQYFDSIDCYHLLFVLLGVCFHMYLMSLLFIVEYLYLIHLVLRACSRIYLILYLCVMICSYDLLGIHKVIHLYLVWVIVIILLLSLFWTWTHTYISYMLTSKLQLFYSILLLDLNWFYMSKGMFLMQFVQSIYLSIARNWSNLLIYLLHLQL